MASRLSRSRSTSRESIAKEIVLCNTATAGEDLGALPTGPKFSREPRRSLVRRV